MATHAPPLHPAVLTPHCAQTSILHQLPPIMQQVSRMLERGLINDRWAPPRPPVLGRVLGPGFRG
jgi:hypothetical protein